MLNVFVSQWSLTFLMNVVILGDKQNRSFRLPMESYFFNNTGFFNTGDYNTVFVSQWSLTFLILCNK